MVVILKLLELSYHEAPQCTASKAALKVLKHRAQSLAVVLLGAVLTGWRGQWALGPILEHNTI